MCIDNLQTSLYSQQGGRNKSLSYLYELDVSLSGCGCGTLPPDLLRSALPCWLSSSQQPSYYDLSTVEINLNFFPFWCNMLFRNVVKEVDSKNILQAAYVSVRMINDD